MKAIDTFKMDKGVLQLYPFLKNQTKGNTGTRKRLMNAWNPLN